MSTSETTEDRAMALLRWFATGDTGLSSETLALASVGLTDKRWGRRAPGDEGDSGRCERLAKMCPFVLEALPGLIERDPEWKRWETRIRSAVIG